MPWIPAGDTHSGKAMSRSNRLILVFTWETSFRTRGRRRYLRYADEFSFTVTWFVAPALKKSESSCPSSVGERAGYQQGIDYLEWKWGVSQKQHAQGLQWIKSCQPSFWMVCYQKLKCLRVAVKSKPREGSAFGRGRYTPLSPLRCVMEFEISPLMLGLLLIDALHGEAHCVML